MEPIEVTGKNVDEALKIALKNFDLKEDEIKFEVIQEAHKGFLNIIGSKPAKIKITFKKSLKDDIEIFINSILNCMQVNANIIFEESDDILNINLTGEDLGCLIGHRGETLDSIQYLVSLLVNKNNKNNKRIVLDAENYRTKRKQTLIKLAHKTAYKVKKSNKKIKLEPMNSYERKIIHFALQDYNNISTFSEGEEPNRKVVIDFKK